MRTGCSTPWLTPRRDAYGGKGIQFTPPCSEGAQVRRTEARRERKLAGLGYRAIHFTNERVLREFESVLAETRAAAAG